MPLDTKLTADDLSTVYMKLYSARTRWFNIGILVKIDRTTLECIRVRNRDDPDGCLREMLTHRLQAEGPLTWRDLCNCLRSPIVGRDDVAEEIIKLFPGDYQVTYLVCMSQLVQTKTHACSLSLN